MTKFVNYDLHQTYDWYTFANKSSQYWPTNNCSRPLGLSTATNLICNLVNQSYNQAPVLVIDSFEIIHKGNADLRVRVDDVEGVVNESQGKIVSPGETWSPPYRLKNFLTFYTSSNTSQQLQISVGAYL